MELNALPADRTGGSDVPPVPSVLAAASASAEALALLAQGGSNAAFAGLVRRFERSLFNFLNMRVGNPDDAEELTQETLLRAWQRIDRYDSRWAFSTWLFTLGKRQAASRFRKLSLRTSGDEGLPDLHAAEDPQDAAARGEERRNLWASATRVLSADQRSALWLRYAEDLSIQEIASVLGKRETTVRVILFRARERLAPCLAHHHEPLTSKPPIPEPVPTMSRLTSASPLAGGQ